MKATLQQLPNSIGLTRVVVHSLEIRQSGDGGGFPEGS